MNILLQIGLIFFICLLGETISALLPIPFPGSVISLILLFLLIFFKLIKLKQIKEFSDFLLGNMAFFFIPAGVGIIKYFDIIKSSIIPLLVVTIITTFLTFASTAFAVSFIIKLQLKHQKNTTTKGNNNE